MNDEQIEQASVLLFEAIGQAVRLVGKDVARSLLIHYLHEVDTDQVEEIAA